MERNPRDTTPPPPYPGFLSKPPASPKQLQPAPVQRAVLSPITPTANQNGNSMPMLTPPLGAPITPASPVIDMDIRRKKFPSDRAYFIAKELLMTERTYKKDLDIIDVWLREEVAKEEPSVELEPVKALLHLVTPLANFHATLLKKLELRLSSWEGRGNMPLPEDFHTIADVLRDNTDMLPLYEDFLAKHKDILEGLEMGAHQWRRLSTLQRDFEAQKVCYLPLTALALKPLHRLLSYDRLLERLMKHHGPHHQHYNTCLDARQKLAPLVKRLPTEMKLSEGWSQLSELRRHIWGCGEVVSGRQQFLRLGCLMKLTRKGFQQRLFLLFSDVLLYCSRCPPTASAPHEFKVHGQLPLRGLLVEAVDDRHGAQHCLAFFSRGRVTTAAANTAEERDRWLTAVLAATKEAELAKVASPVLSSFSSSDEVLPDGSGGADESTPTKPLASLQRSNTNVHVCWHRGASLSLDDHVRAVTNQLSGFLLRKFKNSNGWQKLWVVFTNFCLFFYKTYQDEAPLASLPLLGYTVSQPEKSDNIAKEFVFKLQFKTHVYFFRAESEYTFQRWMQVISSARQPMLD